MTTTTKATHIYKFLRRASDSERNMKVDGSSTAQIFEFSCAQNWASIERVLFRIRDGSIRLNQFGGVAALSNGCKVEVLDAAGATLFDFLDGATLQSLDDFALLAGIDSLVEPTAGDDSWMSRWTISKSGRPLKLNQGERLALTIQDDLSALTHFYALVQGWYT